MNPDEPLFLGNQLDMRRCPHCHVDTPSLNAQTHIQTSDCDGDRKRVWRFYACSRCGGVVTAWSNQLNGLVAEIFPDARQVDEAIPEKARKFLLQAIESLHAPAGAVMLAASAVDAMLKAKGLSKGSLYMRIDSAATDHLITKEMAKWAHEVRLDANDQRHADVEADLPTEADAEKCVDFVEALGEFLFGLPSRVQRGLDEATPEDADS